MDKNLDESWELCSDDTKSAEQSLSLKPKETSFFSVIDDTTKNYFKNDIQDSYELEINDVIPMLSQKANDKLDNIVKNQREYSNKFSRPNVRESRSTIMEKIKMSNENDDLNKSFLILEQKQKMFINSARESDSNPKPLNEKVKEINQIKKSIAFSAVLEDTENTLRDDDNVNYKMDLIRQKHEYLPAKIENPVYGEPKIDLNNLLNDNQTDAQFFISNLKQKNKNFMEAIFD